ncbi:hypothetical protein DID88_008711 [Monilinia fructigena]|uniref:Uncharacterized protein n=1 Tax=Monilinia fructigena TaxID=38457 RepID=A0A395J671_9HELO|nr:hypothetical protein DID88_008711 [Monilinia fructigena]
MLQQLLSQDQPWLMSQPQSTFQSGQQDTAHNVTRFQLSSRLSPDTQTSTGSGHLKDTPPNAPVPQGHSISQPRFNFQAFFDDLRKGDTETPQPKTSPVSVQYHSSDTPQTGFQDNPPLSIDTLESMYLTPLSERPRLSGIWLDNNEAAESTDLRTQLLSRKYFIFDLSKSMIFIAKAYGDAYLSVFVHIQCIQPKLSIQELMDKYVQLVAAELESPLEELQVFRISSH